MARFLKTYSDLLTRRPITMAMVSTGTLSFVGDIVCQYMEHSYSLSETFHPTFKWDIIRSCRFGGIGVVFGPQLAIWYRTLATKIFIGDSFGVAMKRMVVDQALFAPWAICFV
eukprot:393236_1